MRQIKKHGKAAKEALMNEFAQLEDLDVYKVVNASTLTKAEKKAAHRVINLAKEKYIGILKGRTVADGRLQRSLMTSRRRHRPQWQQTPCSSRS
jgi:hypothetical protein